MYNAEFLSSADTDVTAIPPISEESNRLRQAELSGKAAKLEVAERIRECGYHYISTRDRGPNRKVCHLKDTIPFTWQTCGFKSFIADGFIPKLNLYVEVKGGKNNSDSSDQKWWFDLNKILSGVYNTGDPLYGERGGLLYILVGQKHHSKYTNLFLRTIAEYKRNGLPNMDLLWAVTLDQFTPDFLARVRRERSTL